VHRGCGSWLPGAASVRVWLWQPASASGRLLHGADGHPGRRAPPQRANVAYALTAAWELGATLLRGTTITAIHVRGEAVGGVESFDPRRVRKHFH
jgi:hypothetical protein